MENSSYSANFLHARQEGGGGGAGGVSGGKKEWEARFAFRLHRYPVLYIFLSARNGTSLINALYFLFPRTSNFGLRLDVLLRKMF